MALTILDPTAERDAAPERPLAPRGDARTIALVDIRKPRGDVFLDELERAAARARPRRRCARPSRRSPSPRRRTCAARSPQRCDAVIEALAD